ncbi:MAG: class I SAM-dependent methyltransferase [Planctomycetaceae bacterium]
MNRSALKCYQDLLVLAFIEDNIPAGSRILDVGGGHSRVLQHLARDYDCWLIDDFKGGGNGPLHAEKHGYKVVDGLMGQFLKDQLPDNHFDCVFSVSALEHCPPKVEVVQAVIEDLDRVTKPGGFNIHCLDYVIKRETIDQVPIVQQFFFDRAAYPLCSPRIIWQDPDMFKLPAEIYARWKIPHAYEDVAIVDTCAFWPKGDVV